MAVEGQNRINRGGKEPMTSDELRELIAARGEKSGSIKRKKK